MSRFITFALGTALALAPALILAQDSRNSTNSIDQNATNGQVTSQSQDQNNANGQSTMPAATGQQTSTPQQQNNDPNQNTMPATNGQATTMPQNNSTSGQGTVDQNQNGTTTGRGTVDQYNNGTTNGQSTVDQNNPTTTPATPAPVGGNYDNTGSANRSMPATAGGWMGLLLEGGLLGGVGLTLRRLVARR